MNSKNQQKTFILLLSPSKSMDTQPANDHKSSQPAFLLQSTELVNVAKKMTYNELMEFMSISEKLAVLNEARFNNWSTPFTHENAKQALLAFTGDVYDGLDAPSLTQKDLAFAQQHVAILSGLYGILKPLDLIQPYRLEMGRPLKTKNSTNLYQFWSEILTQHLNDHPGDTVINLASQEYSKVINPKKLNKEIISPIFKDEKKGQFKIISFYAKKARGLMARYLIQNRVSTSEELCRFTEQGYSYDPETSSPAAPVFTREESARN